MTENICRRVWRNSCRIHGHPTLHGPLFPIMPSGFLSQWYSNCYGNEATFERLRRLFQSSPWMQMSTFSKPLYIHSFSGRCLFKRDGVLQSFKSVTGRTFEEHDYYCYCVHSAVMGNKKIGWQDVDLVRSNFGKRRSGARIWYYDFMLEGIQHGQRSDLPVGWLISSLGVWSAITKSELKNKHVKSYAKILGDSEFVDKVLSEADKKYARSY